MGQGKVNPCDNLMADGGVIGHGAKFFRIEGGGLAEQILVDCYFADVVQVSGRPQRSHFVLIQSHGLADGCCIAGYAQRMAVNVDVLHVNGRREGLEGVVVEAVQGSQQPEVFGDPLGQSLRQRVVLNRECHVVGEQAQCIQFVVIVESIAFAASQRKQPCEFAITFSGAMHLNSSGATLPLELKYTVVGRFDSRRPDRALR